MGEDLSHPFRLKIFCFFGERLKKLLTLNDSCGIIKHVAKRRWSFRTNEK